MKSFHVHGKCLCYSKERRSHQDRQNPNIKKEKRKHLDVTFLLKIL